VVAVVDPRVVVAVELTVPPVVAVVLVLDGIDPMPMLSHWGVPGILGACRPAYVATNLATSTASGPTTMFWGMIWPEKPPFSIAYRTRVTGRSQRTLKLGPLLSSLVRTN